MSGDTIIPDQYNPQNLNRYSYVRNNPLRYTDPTGHTAACNPMEDDCHDPDPVPSPAPSGGNSNNPNDPTDEEDDPNPLGLPAQSAPEPEISNAAVMATVLDTIAAGLNGGYAIVGDMVGLVCELCYGVVLGGYFFFSFIPNSISTVSMTLWIMDGAQTGENNLAFNSTSTGTTASLSLSQDTIVAVGTNIAGWTVLKDPNAAFGVDAAVAGYDYARMGQIPFVDYTLPAFIHPTITYNTNSGFDFSW